MGFALKEIDEKYRVSGNAEIIMALANERRIFALARALYVVINELSSVVDEGLWNRQIRVLKNYLNRLRSTPLPSSFVLDEEQAVNKSMASIKSMEGVIGEVAARSASRLEEPLSRLQDSSHDPLTDLLIKIIFESEGNSYNLILHKKEFVPEVQDHLNISGLSEYYSVYDAGSYRRIPDTGSTVIIGPPGWLPRHQIFELLSEKTYFALLKWDRRSFDLTCDMPEEITYRGLMPVITEVKMADSEVDSGGSDKPDDPSVETLDELEPVTDWDRIKRAGYASAREHEATRSARIYRLAGGYAAFLPAADDANIKVLDGTSLEPVQRSPDQIEPGDYLILRLERGGEIIEEVANALMGKEAEKRRALQREWKHHLAEHIDQQGIRVMVSRMRDLGSETASRVNLRRWTSMDNIRPHDPEDFRAVLHAIGLGDRAAMFQQEMDIIFRSHHQASSELRKMLNRQLSDADIATEELESDGVLKINLAVEGAGELGILRVIEISDETADVPVYRLRTPFSIE
jgi:hypothetical protein